MPPLEKIGKFLHDAKAYNAQKYTAKLKIADKKDGIIYRRTPNGGRWRPK